jgi:two-component system chemotaxis response regulator CheY
MRILIIDDSAVMRRIVGNALSEAGLKIDEVIEAGNGAEGIAILERLTAAGQAPGLILCDVHMPKLDGIAFLRERAALGLGTAPVLMVTADANDPLIAKAVAAGANGYIAKPFRAEHICDRVRTVMGAL